MTKRDVIVAVLGSVLILSVPFLIKDGGGESGGVFDSSGEPCFEGVDVNELGIWICNEDKECLP